MIGVCFESGKEYRTDRDYIYYDYYFVCDAGTDREMPVCTFGENNRGVEDGGGLTFPLQMWGYRDKMIGQGYYVRKI